MQVALLNSNYLPLQYVDVKKAMTLIYQKKAEIVKKSKRVMRTVNDEYVVPKVIRLVNMVRKHFHPRVVYNRVNIFIRDAWSCQYCDYEGKKLTLDHVIPRSRGGKSGWHNVVASCAPCNFKKADRLIEEIPDMELKKEPKKPTTLMELDWDAIFGEE